MQTSCRTTVEHNSDTHMRGIRRTRPRRTEDTINLDTGQIKSRIYSPDTERDSPVLSRCCPVCRCRAVWVGSSVMAMHLAVSFPSMHRPSQTCSATCTPRCVHSSYLAYAHNEVTRQFLCTKIDTLGIVASFSFLTIIFTTYQRLSNGTLRLMNC